MIESKINNPVSIAILILYNKMLSGHKKVNMALKIRFQDKTKSKRCDCAMQKNDSKKALLLRSTAIKENISILEHVHCKMGIFQTSCK